MTSTDDISIPQIKLSATTNQNGMNCLMFSPLQMVSLGLSGMVSGSGMDGTGINCRGTDRNTCQQSEMPVFTGHCSSEDTHTAKNTYSGISISGLVKLIKTTTPELSGFAFPQIDCLAVNCKGNDNETARVFDNMRMSVATCGNPSRYYNRCYLTGRDYTDSESDQLTGMHFSGAQAIYGDRFYLVSLQYSKLLEPIFPVADAYFNLTNKLIPVTFAAPRLGDLADGREYLKCQVRRTNGQIQLGFIKLDRFSMLSFKSRRDVAPDFLPYITVYFKSNGDGVLDVNLDSAAVDTSSLANNELKFPAHDCFKAIKVSDFLAENLGLIECFSQELGFEQLTLKVLAGLM